MTNETKTKNLPDDQNPAYTFNGANTELLKKLASGEVNARELAQKELANRGMSQKGTWVGFDKARTEQESASRRSTPYTWKQISDALESLKVAGPRIQKIYNALHGICR